MATLGEILLNKHVQMVTKKLSDGEPIKVVAASLAGDLVTEHLAKALGVSMPDPKTVEVKAVKNDNIVDAEFREVK